MQSVDMLTASLLTAMSRVAKIIAANERQPVLQRVRLRIERDAATVSAVNLRDGIAVTMPISATSSTNTGIDVCVVPELTIPEVADVAPHCRLVIDADSNGKPHAVFNFGSTPDRWHIRCKRPVIAGEEFPVVPHCQAVHLLQVELASLKQAAEFAAAPLDETESVHVQIERGQMTMRGQNRYAIYRAEVPCAWLTHYPEGQIPAFTIPARSIKALASLTNSRLISLALDHATLPTQITATLEGGLRATIHCERADIDLPYLPADYVWRLGFDPADLARALTGSRRHDDARLVFTDSAVNTATLSIWRYDRLQRETEIAYSGLRPGARELRFDAVTLRDAAKQFCKSAPIVHVGTGRRVKREMTLHIDALHNRIEWRGGTLTAIQGRSGEMFPLELPPNLYKDRDIFGWETEERKQEKDRRDALFAYEAWLKDNFTLEQRAQMSQFSAVEKYVR